MDNLLLGRYKFLKKLGQGGMGQVLMAHDTVLDRKVAIKILTPELTTKQEFLHRFLREARITASLDHINIVKIYDLVVYNNQYYLIMEYIDGQSLRKFIENKMNNNLNLVMDIFLQILDGMEYAHSKNIVHRDLKPENIMLTKDNIIKITDFGIAFAIGSHSITNPGILMGTLGYLSPEQAKGIDVDHRTDIYSLGVILYELLTSNLPIVASSPAEMIYKILNEKPYPPSNYNKDIPSDIEKIIIKCLEKDKNKRYSNISEIKKEIEKWISTQNSYQSYSQGPSQEDSQNNQNSFEIGSNIKNTNFQEAINEMVQKTISDIISEISSYKRNIQDIVVEKTIKSQEFIKPSIKEIDLLISKAQKEYENKNYSETIKILETLLPYHKTKKVLYILSKSNYKIGDYNKAMYYVGLYKRDFGENEKILALEGDILYSLGDYVNSYASYYKAYELTNDRYYLLLASRSAINYNPELAIDYLSSIISVETDQHISAKCYKYLGLAYYKLGNYELAIQNLEYYLKNYNDHAVINPLIRSYKMVGKNLELAKIYSSLLEATDNQDILKEALAFYLSTSKYKEAIETCYRLISIYPDDLGVYQDLYLASKAVNNTASLILAIENILRLHTDLSLESKAELLEELVDLYKEEQQYIDAIATINKLIQIKGNKLEYKDKLAQMYYKLGNYETALNLLYEMVSLDSINPNIYEKISLVYHSMGKITEAIESIKTAINIDPSNYRYYKILVNLYLEANKTRELIKLLKDLIDYNPDDIEAYILLSQVYLITKNYHESYESIIIAYSKATLLDKEIPLKTFDILLYSLYGIFKSVELINKFKELVFEIKKGSYLPYLYYSIGFFYWINGYEINAMEYLNNSLMISKESPLGILSKSLVNFIKGKYFEAINYLNQNYRIFKESNINEIKKRYYELILTMYLLTNDYNFDLQSYFGALADVSERYDLYGLFLKAMFIEKLAKNKADYSNALFWYEKAISQGFENENILFRTFFINLIIKDLRKAKEYLKMLIKINPSDNIYKYYSYLIENTPTENDPNESNRK